MSRHRIFGALGLIWLLAVSVSSRGLAQEDASSDKLAEARGLVEQGDFSEAIPLLKEVTEADPEAAEAWFLLGYSLHLDGQLDEAMKAHKRAAESEQFSGIANYNIGCVHALQGDRDAALTSLQKAIDLGFDQADQFASDSDLYALHTDVRFAKMLALLNDEDEVAAKLDEAEALIGEEDFDKAAEAYRAILEMDRFNPFATYRLGFALHGAGDLDAALEMHEKATQFEGVAPTATYNIGCVHSLRDNPDEAFKYLEKAVDLGFVRPEAFEEDPDLANIRSDSRFEKLLARVRELADN